MALDANQGRRKPLRARRAAVAPRASRLQRPLCVSVLLHVGAVMLLLRLEFDTSPAPPPPDDPDRFVIRVTQFNPQRMPLPEPALVETAPERDGSGAEQDSQIAIVEESGPGNVIDSNAIGGEDLGEAESAAETITAVVDEGADGAAEVTDNPGGERDATALRNAVSAYIDTTYRRGLGASWVEDCLRYKNQHGVSDCPRQEEAALRRSGQAALATNVAATFRAYVGGNASNATESRRLLQDMEYLRPLMQDVTVLGDLARQRYYLAEDQYLYLNPNGLQVIAGESIIPVAQISRGKLVLLSGLLTLSFTEGVMLNDETIQAPAVPFRRYRTQALQQPDDEESRPGFARQAPLFPLRR